MYLIFNSTFKLFPRRCFRDGSIASKGFLYSGGCPGRPGHSSRNKAPGPVPHACLCGCWGRQSPGHASCREPTAFQDPQTGRGWGSGGGPPFSTSSVPRRVACAPPISALRLTSTSSDGILAAHLRSLSSGARATSLGPLHATCLVSPHRACPHVQTQAALPTLQGLEGLSKEEGSHVSGGGVLSYPHTPQHTTLMWSSHLHSPSLVDCGPAHCGCPVCACPHVYVLMCVSVLCVSPQVCISAVPPRVYACPVCVPTCVCLSRVCVCVCPHVCGSCGWA